MHERLITNETLRSIADRRRKTVPQIILRWDVQNGIVPIPKASSPARLRENIDICNFALSSQEMKSIDLLNAEFRVRYDPDNCDFSRL